MHIMALEDAPTSLRGGQELNLFEICHGLAQRGHQISLIYSKNGNLLDRYQQFCQHTIKIDRYGFDRRKLVDVVGFLPSLAKIPTLPTQSNTVIFSNSCHPAFFSYLLSRYHQHPFICYIQTPSFSFNRQKLLGLQGAKRFITVSNQMKHYWSDLGYPPQTIDVVHNGTNLSQFQPTDNLATARAAYNLPESSRVISYVGRLDPEKGVETLIKAFSQLPPTIEPVKLLIAGKSVMGTNLKSPDGSSEGQDYQSRLEQLVNDLGLPDRVTFLGHVSDPRSLYQISDVTVVPSLWAEPFGRVVIEAMACGTPVVASHTGGIPEILTGEFRDYLVAPGNEPDLAKTLAQVLNWRATKPDLGQRCRDHVLQQFSLEKMVDGIEKVLVKVVNHA
ncbi:glycosyltransferase family 4 protein [Pantanalinema rosaneae CENA516]|uniref:glycosyltransferase family 4 protein n=1 Tax=Pantanalinema rosaneae TaxID=1620701 RepID=UPI003D6EABF3